MSEKLKQIVQSIRTALGVRDQREGELEVETTPRRSNPQLRYGLIAAAVLVGGIYLSVDSVAPGEVVVRTNQLTGSSSEFRAGSMLAIPGLHQLRRFSLREQLYHPTQSSKANGDAPFQSVEGLSVGVDLTVHYALDPARVLSSARKLPDDIGGQVVQPAVQGVIYKTFTRYTVREIFSTKRGEIQQTIESELRPKLAGSGLVLLNVQIGKVDLPADYRAGLEKMLAEELASEQMRYTLELKDKQVKQTALEAEAEKVKREKAAEAAGNEQIIAAKAQEEAMKHVLPFKQKQIEQRQLEAEADKVSRIKTAEGSAQARVIEAGGEADSRRKLADAEVYRQQQLAKASSDQMAVDGALLSKHPLLIQKAMADKLSDKISVIIAPTPKDGGFIGAALLGAQQKNAAPQVDAGNNAQTEQQAEEQ
ncbi:Regulator of protease activity HflC, stomatin/prohibitin superfamily [Andreprevotia lacus DSM 23236]|jgi:regulator of protease activity HflC (stomatin/prohibitin superfamily)|uniref:Regulator of protease activity HflC, stomatin/prohibitin superfamily n=1 Tax=Andreprevotia lacus DSM 23236 TaxID=1121001 RepID=A0A1W1XP12_9NEIS|nr:SPFH domain-containing protein [Andreprevotia lacus]SMC25730.1 Regulator of protease activity HflC, stomatin/prohibitin superfamily [Andreprevotia lacus DSM 23236]